jgi:hypothetical protein
MPNTGNTEKQTSPSRPRHQISRSISELSPIRVHRHHHRKDRERDDSIHHTQSANAALALQTALLPPRRSLEVPRTTRGSRSEADTPNMTPDQSRRGSIMVPVHNPEDGTMSPTVGALLGAGLFGAGTALPSRKRSAVREDELRLEKIRSAARASGLKRSIVELNAFSNTTTRRLDDSYYSVLEKVGMLQNTVLALKELAGMSAETDEQFRRESEDLVNDITGQLGAFGEFEEQAGRIEGLTSRIHGGRDKVRMLGERVEAVREKIERWERADREWQERTRRRLKAIWVVTLVILLVVVVLLVAAQYVPASAIEGVRPGVGEGAGGGSGKGLLGSAFNKTMGPPVDERLRVFDEL